MRHLLITILFSAALQCYGFTSEELGNNSKAQEQVFLEKSHLIGMKSDPVKHSYNIGFPVSSTVNIKKSVKAPNGKASQYASVTGRGYFAFEINNYNTHPITCIVTKLVCMNINDPNSCRSFTETFVIEKKGRVRDHGSYLSNTYIYKRKGKAYTLSKISFDGCSNYKNNKYKQGHYRIS